MDIISPILFYIVALSAIFAAVMVVLAPRIVYSVVSAFIFFILVSFVYLMLNAPFNAAAQLVIYGVAVSIVFVFSLMMTSYNKDKSLGLSLSPRLISTLLGLSFIFVAVFVFTKEDLFNQAACNLFEVNINNAFDTTFYIAKGLFTDYIFAYELLSVFLLLAVVGLGVVLSFKKGDDQ